MGTRRSRGSRSDDGIGRNGLEVWEISPQGVPMIS